MRSQQARALPARIGNAPSGTPLVSVAVSVAAAAAAAAHNGVHDAACIAPLMRATGVSKAFGATRVLAGIDLSISAGEFVAVVGFSGSGKSTLLNLLSGLLLPDSGTITMRDLPVHGPGPERGVMFQNYALMPWLNVYDNIALSVNQVCRGESRARRAARVQHYLELVNLGPARHKLPAELSGGMRQRVALARALAMKPEVLLLDEPLSALDALTRANLQDELLQICAHERTTVLLITNDVDEALLLADRVLPLEPGPDAGFGREFLVDLPRPRQRLALIRDPRFIALRKTVTDYLLALGDSRGTAQTETLTLPDVQPITSRSHSGPGGVHSEPSPELEVPRYVDLWRVSKRYPSGAGEICVVDDFNLHIGKREFVSIIGHSGCGKSTVLSMLAGLTPISAGGIVLDYREIDGAGPDRALVFQSPNLVPWLSAWDNVRLGVERVYPHATKAQQQAVIHYYLARVGLGDVLHKRAAELSNGMRQRVGIARAFALAPKLLLLDEPFGMLDSLTRWELQTVLMDVWQRSQLTAVLVTHDVDEAILMADRVVMMTNGPNARVGRILKVNLPRPRTRQQLLDHPAYNEMRAELIDFLAACDHK